MKTSEEFKEMEKFIEKLQDKICFTFEGFDDKKFRTDIWEREEGGGGITKIIENGRIFEKGGVNISSVSGVLPGNIASQLNVKSENFAACGLSLVIHPFSPRIPTIHMNIRSFEMESGKKWYGGGIDLTPYYPYRDDFIHFHSVMQNACERVIEGSYFDYKKECDEYFSISHRDEMRGIGGIFFDYKSSEDDKFFRFVKSVGEHFLDSYLPIIEKRKDETFTDEDKQFQLFRRGRYVEFNLVYDRGTLFGLRTNGRIESVLMSLPPIVTFPYDFILPRNSVYEEMTKYYQPQIWI